MSLLAGNFSCIRYIAHLDYLEKFGIVHSLNHHKVTIRSDFETGAFIQKFNPHVLLINLLAKGIDAADFSNPYSVSSIAAIRRVPYRLLWYRGHLCRILDATSKSIIPSDPQV